MQAELQADTHDTFLPDRHQAALEIRHAWFGVEIRVRLIGVVILLLGALLMGKAIHLMSLDNQGDFELFMPTGWNQIRFKELFVCGVVVLCSGIGLSKLQTWGYFGSLACVLFFLNAGLNVLPQVFWMALVAVVLLVALLLPGNFFVIRGLYQDVTSRTSGIKYRVRVWGGAILSLLLLAVVFWVSE